MKLDGIELRVKGKVQGVGFRPFVWQLAHRMNLKGEVLNDGQGVLIRLISHANLDNFQRDLIQQQPPLAKIESVQAVAYQWQACCLPETFTIIESQSTSIDTQIVPDAATCPECLEELLEKHGRSRAQQDRRYHYPFINCTHCGPRFTIIQALPYDRPKTVMHHFPMCSTCETEYKSPHDRRYHAQPVACPSCGPMVQIAMPDGTIISNHTTQQSWLSQVISALNNGEIIAIKSVGGFHLACDATNIEAVQTLRNRKQRQIKPFAVMVHNTASIERFADLNEWQMEKLQSSAAPIVLMYKKQSNYIAPNIAPELNEIGVMLPSNPLQHLIAHQFNKPVVMTSGNQTGLPPSLDNQQALNELNYLADLFILHNRAIIQRCDDSLIRVNEQGQQETLRRSRGFIPDAVTLPDGFPSATGFLACGGDLKNAIAISKNNQIIVSQYLGDLSNTKTQQQYHDVINHFSTVYGINITHYVADLHPYYFSHQFARAQAEKHPSQIALTFVQHHHAHVAACLVENQWQPSHGQVMALVLDGLGFGEDGHLWGAELMIADYCDYQVIGGLPSIPFVGGDKVAKEPWRSYYAHLNAFCADIHQDEMATIFAQKPLDLLNTAMNKAINCHSIRSAGRFFDAVAASLGIAFEQIEYEGAAASQLEALASRCQTKEQISPIEISHHQLRLDLSDFWPAFLNDKRTKEEKAYLFHVSLATALANLVIEAQKANPQLTHLVLSGGVFHNVLFTTLIKKALHNQMDILQHQQFSCGDGSLALGQIAIAMMKGTNSLLAK